MEVFFLQAERLLKHSGDFLVRESAKIPGQFILTGRYQDHYKHLLLVDPEGVVKKNSSIDFADSLNFSFRSVRKIMNSIQFNI